jgi:adenosylcobinamide-GDP ribazoletransferase
MIRPAMLAWHFLTIIPLSRTSQVNPSSRDLASSMQWYPLVGALIGGMLVAGDYVFGQVLSTDIVTLLLLCFLVVVTGGLHQDGIADTIDGIAKRGSIQERLAVMKDSSIGALGATGLLLALGLRFGGMLHLSSPDRMYLLLCMPVVGRWAMVVSAFGSTHARGYGIASDFFAEIQWRDVFWATVWLTAILCGTLGVFVGGMVLVGGIIVTKLLVFAFTRVFGGLTGDMLGAINEVTEILFLLFCPLLLVWASSYP